MPVCCASGAVGQGRAGEFSFRIFENPVLNRTRMSASVTYISMGDNRDNI